MIIENVLTKALTMTTLLSRFLRESESKSIQAGAKSAPIDALQVKPMLDGRTLQACALGKVISGCLYNCC